MPQHRETRILPYTPPQLFDLVADVAAYPQFLPWCVGARIVWRKENRFNADVLIGYKFIREGFNSTVTLTPHRHIGVDYQKGPCKHLRNSWDFLPVTQNGQLKCQIDFFIDFEFHVGLLGASLKPIFSEATKRMVDAFEQRARHIYGPHGLR